MKEWAILVDGEIVNVVTAESRESAERVAQRTEFDAYVAPLDNLPLDVKQRYRYWDDRP